MFKLPPLFAKRIFVKAGPPIHLIWFVTSRCDLRCLHCFYHRQVMGKSQDFSFDEISRVISQMSPMLSITLTGGEPFLRDDLVDIVRFLAESKVTENLLLFSNGYDTGNIITKMERILSATRGINVFLGISIDGTQAIHDEYRDRKGSYQNAVNTVKALKIIERSFPNLNIGIGTTLHRGNQDIIEQLRSDIFAKFGIKPGITLIRGEPKSAGLKGVDPGIYKKVVRTLEADREISQHISLLQTIVATREVLGQKLAVETFIRKRRSYACYAGSLMAVLYENGDVYPCETLKDSLIGNLKDYGYDINKLWRSSKADAVRKRIRSGKCYCAYECQYTCNTLYNIRFLPYFLKNALKYVMKKFIIDPAYRRGKDLKEGR